MDLARFSSLRFAWFSPACPPAICLPITPQTDILLRTSPFPVNDQSLRVESLRVESFRRTVKSFPLFSSTNDRDGPSLVPFRDLCSNTSSSSSSSGILPLIIEL
ncbi:hypothetical protein C8R46DRAFT_1136683 [Mycena filopes]|nr:hypothetical protein C8R46DRAFT_1136683 [Mycena filopes]